MASPDAPAPGEMPDAGFTHTAHGFFGEQLTIVAYAPVDAEDGGAVEFVIRNEHGRTAGAHISSPAEREALMRALMEAYRVAGGEKPPAGAPRGWDWEERPGLTRCHAPALHGVCGHGYTTPPLYCGNPKHHENRPPAAMRIATLRPTM